MTEHDRKPLPASDRALLRQWASTYRPALVKFIARRAPGYIDPEDIAQEVFEKLAKRSDLGAIERPEKYLFQAAATTLASAYRKAGVRKATAHESFEDGDEFATGFTPERVLMGRETLRVMARALKQLPDRTVTIFMLYHVKRHLQTDIAKRLGVHVSTVEKALRAANLHLLDRMDKDDLR